MTDRSNGRHTKYVITPDQYASRTSLGGVPVRQANQSAKRTGPAGERDPSASRTGPVRQADSNHKEPSRTKEQKKERAVAPPQVACPDGVTGQTWTDWLSLRKAKRAPVTETVVNHAKSEAAKAGMSLEAFLKVWCARGSQGLEASWLKPNERAGPAAAQPVGKTMQGIMSLEALKNGLANAGSGDGNPAALVSEPRRLPGR
jgi:hypothetical protein